jgi:2-polyprenyl-3-methyl-5-hydroxy-6-metoxy-1,4-benzoquinol methylase
MRREFYAEQSDLRLEEYRRKLDRLQAAGAGGRLLEVGSAAGVFLDAARQRGFQVEGIEPNENDRRAAQERYGLAIRPGGVEDQEFPAASFDVVFSSHVFEHLLDPLWVATRIVEWLRPGGFHMIEVPNQFDTLWMKLNRWSGRANPKPRDFLSIHHPVFFSPLTLRTLVESSGCSVLSVGQVHYRRFGLGSLGQDPRSALIQLINMASRSSAVIDVLARKK